MSFCRGVLEKGLAQIRRCIKHMDFGTVVLMGAVAYGLGLFWYGLILGRSHDTIWLTAAFSFIAIVFGETYAQLGLQLGHLHPLTALIAALVGVLVDWDVGWIRGAWLSPKARTPSAR